MNRFHKAVKWMKGLAVLLIVISVTWVLIYRVVNPPMTLSMVDRMSKDEGKLQYKFIRDSQISDYLKVCAMAAEDQNLPFHKGIDVAAIKNAAQVNKKTGKLFGGSTISQQVAKNVFLFQNRSYFRKGLELYFTILIETLWPKDRILEMYLNVAEMGSLVFGAEAAAQSYFNKSCSKLTLNEAAILIAVLPSPRKYRVKGPSNFVLQRQSKIKNLYHSLDGTMYLRELYVDSDRPLYDFKKYKK